MHTHNPAHRADPPDRVRPRAGVIAMLAGIVAGALVLFGAPAVVAADDLAAVPTAEVTAVAPAEGEATEPEAPPPPETAPEPPAEPVAEPPAEPVAEPPAEPVAEPPVEPVPEPPAEPVAESAEPIEAVAPEPEPALAAQTVAVAEDPGGPPIQTGLNDHVAICHATSSESNPYVFINPSVRSIISPVGDPGDPFHGGQAHAVHQDAGDIIPAFDYLDSEGNPQHFPGLNLDLIDILENECGAPVPTVQLSVVCPPGGDPTPALNVSLSGLLVTFDYELRVFRVGDDEEVASLSITPTGAVFNGELAALPPGEYLVRLEREGVTVRTAVVTIAECPPPPPPVPGWELMKSSVPADGATVMPGDIVSYTLTAENTSQAVVIGAQAFDDISDVLDDATLLLPLPAGLTGPVGGVLTWSIPDLDPGETASVTYQVRVDANSGGQLLHNVVVPSQGGECPVGGADANGPCVVDHPVKPTPPPPAPAKAAPVTPVRLAESGVETGGLMPLGAALVLLGAAGSAFAARRRSMG
ncbi:DUF7927 domain-containing protein [Agromyces ramosus]|uniref:Repeat protein (TIGR01451 family) n=1 Tax=Agromyces ramosus TaxID=33879 RepID=A0ABU0RB97_9MICO|nr:hypothetical protein [Agromyces ramosus]MDQ0895355.1 putative repeat protein (TIGR01451 family) [Agromyces ramosus]